MHSELLEVSLLEPGQIAMPQGSGKDLQKTHSACPERTCRASCFGDQELVWNSLRQGPVFKSSAKITTAVAQHLPLVVTYTKMLGGNEFRFCLLKRNSRGFREDSSWGDKVVGFHF